MFHSQEGIGQGNQLGGRLTRDEEEYAACRGLELVHQKAEIDPVYTDSEAPDAQRAHVHDIRQLRTVYRIPILDLHWPDPLTRSIAALESSSDFLAIAHSMASTLTNAPHVEILKMPLEKYAAALSLVAAGLSTFEDADLSSFGLLLQSAELKEVCQNVLRILHSDQSSQNDPP
jgi:hypothetical protein